MNPFCDNPKCSRHSLVEDRETQYREIQINSFGRSEYKTYNRYRYCTSTFLEDGTVRTKYYWFCDVCIGVFETLNKNNDI